jgi:sugar phosphate isomerase/epimerase
MAKEPKYSILEYATLNLSFADELAAFREGGAQGVGITEFTGPKARERDTMVETLRNSGLEPTVCWPAVPSVLPLTLFGGPQDPEDRVEAMCNGIRSLRSFNPVACGCVTGAQGDYGKIEARQIVVEGLREAARVASSLGLRLALEPIHPSIAEQFTIITTIQQTIDLIELVGEGNIGISFDTWHSWDQPNLFEEIERYTSHFLIVHVGDYRQPTRSWCDRVMPGDGVANVPAILGALEAAGYDGWYETEVLSDNGLYGNAFPDSLWNLSPVELVRQGREALLRCWERRTVLDRSR